MEDCGRAAKCSPALSVSLTNEHVCTVFGCVEPTATLSYYEMHEKQNTFCHLSLILIMMVLKTLNVNNGNYIIAS